MSGVKWILSLWFLLCLARRYCHSRVFCKEFHLFFLHTAVVIGTESTPGGLRCHVQPKQICTELRPRPTWHVSRWYTRIQKTTVRCISRNSSRRELQRWSKHPARYPSKPKDSESDNSNGSNTAFSVSSFRLLCPLSVMYLSSSQERVSSHAKTWASKGLHDYKQQTSDSRFQYHGVQNSGIFIFFFLGLSPSTLASSHEKSGDQGTNPLATE